MNGNSFRMKYDILEQLEQFEPREVDWNSRINFSFKHFTLFTILSVFLSFALASFLSLNNYFTATDVIIYFVGTIFTCLLLLNSFSSEVVLHG